MADPTAPLTPAAARLLREYAEGNSTAETFHAAAEELIGAGFLAHSAITPAGRAHVENVIGRLVPLTNREILSIIDSLTHTFGHGTAGIGEGALRDRLSGLLEKAQPDLTTDEATLLRWISGEPGAGVPFRDEVRRVNDATRGLHQKGMVETFRWALTAAGIDALRVMSEEPKDEHPLKGVGVIAGVSLPARACLSWWDKYAGEGLTPEQTERLSAALMRQHADIANALAGVAGVPGFVLSVPEARLLWRFFMGGDFARRDFNAEEEVAWQAMDERLHGFIVSLQEKEKTDG